MMTQSIQKHDTEPTAIQQNVEYYFPAVDILEDNEAFTLKAELPGVETSDVDIHYENGTLTLEAKVNVDRATKKRNFLLREYGVGNFRRSFTISTPIDSDSIKAELKNGVLTLHVPKAESVKTRKIAVQPG